MRTHLIKHKALYSVILVLLATGITLYFYPPNVLVQTIGVENSYLITFLIACIGGLSSFTSGVYYTAVATFSSGGANPWLLGISGGIGIAIGDSIVFGLFKYGFSDVKDSWKDKVDKLRKFVEARPRWLIYVLLFILLGFTPMPNDIVMFALVILGFKLKEVFPLVVLTGITITILTAYAGQSLSSFFF